MHLGLAHALANAAALLALAVALLQRLSGRALWLAVSGGCAGSALVVALDPGCGHYAGASGALHGGLAGGLAWLARAPRSAGSPVILTAWPCAALALLLLKIALEALVLLPAPWPFPVYWPAHLAGAAGGLLAALASSPALAAAPSQAQQRE